MRNLGCQQYPANLPPSQLVKFGISRFHPCGHILERGGHAVPAKVNTSENRSSTCVSGWQARLFSWQKVSFTVSHEKLVGDYNSRQQCLCGRKKICSKTKWVASYFLGIHMDNTKAAPNSRQNFGQHQVTSQAFSPDEPIPECTATCYADGFFFSTFHHISSRNNIYSLKLQHSFSPCLPNRFCNISHSCLLRGHHTAYDDISKDAFTWDKRLNTPGL